MSQKVIELADNRVKVTNMYGKNYDELYDVGFDEVVEFVKRNIGKRYTTKELYLDLSANGMHYNSLSEGNGNRNKMLRSVAKKVEQEIGPEYYVDLYDNKKRGIYNKIHFEIKKIDTIERSELNFNETNNKYERMTREESQQYIQVLKDLGLTKNIEDIMGTKLDAYKTLFLLTGALGKCYRMLKDAEDEFIGSVKTSRTEEAKALNREGYIEYIDFLWCRNNIAYKKGTNIAPRVPINLTESGRAYLEQRIRLLPDSAFKNNVMDKLRIEEPSDPIQDTDQTGETVNKDVQLSNVYETENLVTKAESLEYINFLKSKGITQGYMSSIENKTDAYRILFLLTGVLGKCYRMVKDADKELIENKPNSRASTGPAMREDGYIEYMDFEGDNVYIKYKEGVAPRVPITVTESGRIYLMELVTALPDSEIRTNLLALLVGNNPTQKEESVIASKEEQTDLHNVKDNKGTINFKQYILSGNFYKIRQQHIEQLVNHYYLHIPQEDLEEVGSTDIRNTVAGDLEEYIKTHINETPENESERENALVVFKAENIVKRLRNIEVIYEGY